MVFHLPYLDKRLKIIKTIRSFLDERGFWEVDTPALQKSPGLEIHQAAFETTLIEPFHQDDKIRYLHTSPEFAMKKLLVAGMDKIYQKNRGKTIFLWGHYHRDSIEAPHCEMYYNDIEELDTIAARWDKYDETDKLDWWLVKSPYFEERWKLWWLVKDPFFDERKS